ncbi:hypothetical protein DL89DRAFT_265681 [Linderina pennispora]|uniref:Endonuclease/exonuclease/phosphatase domain-containing protein n=1 Tax=Linderina pennispora TaxID=61395 RepID=A0A1Y1WFA7_9FUNG|nr:uncharacterized protein DL89DRAFT_265681 [Linderina pennispora]ORX71998.1 hypothetical protein DL89DRAFT_265681 [Linderina pennispora]
MAGTKRKAITAAASLNATKKAATEITIPTNKTMPTDYSFIEPAPAGTLKLVSYNVNSLNAACKKGWKEYLKAEDPDVICLQETKMNQAPAFLVSKTTYPFQYWHCSKTKKGYAGTAGPKGTDNEGRVINVEFADFYLKLVRLDRRMKWDKYMDEHLAELEKTKPVVYAGDLNVAHHPVDLARPDTNKRSAGFTVEEREGFTKILESAGRGYTYFGYRAGARDRGVGWRLDYFVVSGALMDRVVDVVVRNQCYGASDHVPLVMYLKKGAEEAGETAEAVEAVEEAEIAEPETADKDSE